MFTVEFWKPEITTSGSDVIYSPKGSYLATVRVEGDFSFTIEADGGYWDFATSFEVTEPEIDEWIKEGVGRTVVVFDPGLELIWMGFVNQVDAGVGNLAVSVGPLTDIANRVTVYYTLQDEVDGEIVSTQMQTTTADNETSKLKYGVWEKSLSAGTTYDANEASDVRDAYLAESAYPETAKTWSNSGGGTTVSLSCRGFGDFLKNWIVTEADAEADNNIIVIYDPSDATNSKLTIVLREDPNNLLTDTYATWDFDSCDVDVWEWEDQATDAYSLVRSLVERGDGDGGRMTFGIYADRDGLIARYKAIPTEIEYQQSIRDSAQTVREYQGSEVDYWNVLPGNWLLFTDFLVGRQVDSPPNADPRAMFIERVAFSTPEGLTLDGEKIHTVKQRLADFGISL